MDPVTIAAIIASLAAEAAGPIGQSILALTNTLKKVLQGEEPTAAELAHLDAEQTASNARMNAAVARALVAEDDEARVAAEAARVRQL